MKHDRHNQLLACFQLMQKAVVLPLLLLMMFSSAASAADIGTFAEPSTAFTWFQNGQGCMRLKLMLTSRINNSTYRDLKECVFYLKDDMGNISNILYASETNTQKGYAVATLRNMMATESHAFLANDKSGTPWYIPGQNQDFQVSNSGAYDHPDTWLEIDWYFPVRMAGKRYTMGITGKLWMGGSNREDYNREIGTIEFPELPLQVYDAYPGYEEADFGKLILPVVCDRDINWVEVSYKDSLGQEHTLPRVTLDKTNGTNYTCFVPVTAYEAHHDLKVKANVVSASWTNVVPEDAPRKLEGDVTLDVGNVAMLHGPQWLTATPADDGSVVLKWKIADLGFDDVFEGDQFVIERSLTGQDSDFTAIGTELFDKSQWGYTFKDSMLVQSLKPELIDQKLGIPLVRYRVSRASAQSMWGNDKNHTVAYAQPQFAPLSLLQPIGAKAAWGADDGEDNRRVTVSWDYRKSDEKHTYVWDDRAEMTLEVLAYNAAGELVDSTSVALSTAQRVAKTMDVQVSRSCVNYSMRLRVNGKSSPIGRGTGNIFFVIDSDEDFITFRDRVLAGETGLNAIVTRDVNAKGNSIASDSSKPYTGNFNGNGHNVSINFNMHTDYAGLFRFVGKGAVLSNVNVKGQISSPNKFVGGLTGYVMTGPVNIENCVSYVDLYCSKEGNQQHGGLVARADGDLRISNSMFRGGMLGQAADYCGGILGWRKGDSFVKIANTYFDALAIAFSFAHSRTFMCSNNDNDIVWAVLEDCTYDGAFGAAQGVSSAFPPSNWCWKDGVPAVRQITFNPPTADNVADVAMPADRFYFSNNGKVEEYSLNTKTLQSSVLLTWECSPEGSVDYYEVWRMDMDSEQEYSVIATQITDLEYEDKTVRPLHQYYYKVVSAVDCEGKHFSETHRVIGKCVETCMIEGYVRFADGTGVPGERVVATPDGNTTATSGGSATTDESGYYCISGLPYWGGTTGKYNISTKNGGDMLSVEFDTSSNHVTGKNFTVKSSVKFSGYVMFEGTSIPVQNVGFKVDGREVMTASGKVLTDFSGQFAFRMTPGEHSVQAFKDGHVFWQDGFYMDGNKTNVNFDTDKAQVYFYDQTTVTLIGRICGGKDQGSLPLDNSLSRNNLGDNLKMVMSLEGDNTSWLVYDNTDTNKKEDDKEFAHGRHDRTHDYKTKVHYTRHRLEISPDPTTGEYKVELPPVKWKITQISAQGYPSLFQEGKTGDVIDLTDSLTRHTDHYNGAWTTPGGVDVVEADVSYHAIYNRIYHSPVKLNSRQLTYDTFDYFGDRNYTARSTASGNAVVALATPVRKEGWPVGKKDSLEAKYTFGYPVFSIERSYPVKLSATETYYYNNDEIFGEKDVVKLSGGVVTVRNGMVSSMHRDTVQLDENGEAVYKLTAAQLPYLLTDDKALRTVTMTLLMDGTYYEAEPLRAYVLNIFAKSGSRDLLTVGQPSLVDVLRDPPGGGSSAKLSKGTQFKYAFTLDYKGRYGGKFSFGFGTSWNTWAGVATGIYSSASNLFSFDLELVWNLSGQNAYSYTMTANSDISTSSDKKMVGADGDVYIGMETNITMTPTVSIRAIPDSHYQQLRGEEAAGRLVVIATSTGDDGKPVYLVREELATLGPKVTSTFAHSQNYILTQLIPNLEEQCKALMFTGTPEQAKQQANVTGKPVYLSLRSHDDENFGVLNTKKVVDKGDETWEYVYNTTVNKPTEGINYQIILPDSWDKSNEEDKVADFCDAMMKWCYMIAQNEKVKMTATTLMQNYDVDGGAPISYSEEFTTQSDDSNSKVDITTNSTYGGDDEDDAYKFSFFYNTIIKTTWTALWKLISKAMSSEPKKDNDQHITTPGVRIGVSLLPIIEVNYTPKYSTSGKYTRKESFSISMDRKSHLNFDVFYAETKLDTIMNTDWNSVYSNFQFDGSYDDVTDKIFSTNSSLTNPKVVRRGFVYRTRGGATCRPYEGERTTKYYNMGSVLDQATRKIEKPVITLDKQSVSGVPMGEPARFKLYLANESEQPEAAHPYWLLMLNELSNPNGAKIMMDGMPLSGDGRTMEIHPGKVTEKTIEVYAGEAFDYENLSLRLQSQGDVGTYCDAQFSVHFLRAAGAVSISSPGDKWIMNTDAPYDSIRGWYLPVVISGYDKNQHNFDHIELQYKETTRGDDYWVNLCSFFADSLYYNTASGTKEMIPANGYINTRFYGEGKEMEKGYDLRAVLFCRNGNGFLTNSSAVLAGVKDTRRPQLFGTAEPKNGILGSGDNIIFNFSEDIEHNYLSGITNFEVVGETNETALAEGTTLYFGGKGYAQSQSRRNFTDKNVTIDVMVKPDLTDTDMPIFSHGTDGHNLQLWVTAEKKLKAVVDDVTLVSDKAISFDRFSQVALVLDNANKRLSLYNDSLIGSMDNVSYSGYGVLIFGSTNQSDVSRRTFYKGRMMEGRVWNRALNETLLNTYGKQELTGYEVGLTDYYPMDEGEGAVAVDQSIGSADLTLTGTSWALPRGMSLYLDWDEDRDVKGLQLKTDFIARSKEQDYTLMFWFKTDRDGRGALLSNGSGRATDVNAADRFFIGFEGETLKYRSNGQEYRLGDSYSDDAWHHYAMTVNRSQQVCNIYVDNVLKASFLTDQLGGMTGNNFYLGNMVWQETGNNPELLHYQNALTGHIDELCLFQQALPTTLIKRYAKKSPSGKERGLITYLGFNRQERTKQNDLELFPYAMNQVIITDEDGVEHLSTDSVFVVSTNEIMQHIDPTLGAPVQPFQELKNLAFSFVGKDNQLLVNIDELDKKINKKTVYVTVTDVPDKNGNYMASPATESFYVNRNPLTWGKKKVTQYWLARYDSSFHLTFTNNSGSAHVYTIENLPRWMTAEKTSDIIEAQSTEDIIVRVGEDLNAGTFDQIIYLTDENGLSEPLLLECVIWGDDPDWEVDRNLKRYSMNVVAQVSIGDAIVTNTNDLVAAFDKDGRCMGVANVDYNAQTGLSLVYLTVYNDTNDATELSFRLWHYDTGKTMLLTTPKKIKFGDQTTEGTVKNPVMMTASDLYIQQLNLKAGWNWVSFNVYNDDLFSNIATLLNMFEWKDGDIVTEDSQDLTLAYKNGHWMSNSNTDISKVSLSTALSYRVKTQRDFSFDIFGSSLKRPEQRVIHVKPGWNSIGYTPLVNLPVATALAEYWSFAQDGDIIKSQNAFAQFYEGTDGKTEWMGSLKYMKPGEGYMLYRQKEGEISFRYPFYEPGSTFIDTVGGSSRSGLPHSTTMTIVAEATDIDLQEGDRLVAYATGEPVGEAVAVASPLAQADRGSASSADTSLMGAAERKLFFLSVNGDIEVPLTFTIERPGMDTHDIVAVSPEVMTYQADAICGTVLQPTSISFVKAEQVSSAGWYDLSGRKIANSASGKLQRGVYVSNGKKVIK